MNRLVILHFDRSYPEWRNGIESEDWRHLMEPRDVRGRDQKGAGAARNRLLPQRGPLIWISLPTQWVQPKGEIPAKIMLLLPVIDIKMVVVSMMFKFNKFISSAFFLLILSSGVVHAQLVNPGFETGDSTGWTISGVGPARGGGEDGDSIPNAYYPPAYVNVRSGNHAAWAAVGYGYDEFLSLSQTIEFLEGEYSIGFFLGLDQSEVTGIEFAIRDGLLGIFVDGQNIGFDVREAGFVNIFPTGSTPADMYEFSALTDLSAGPHTIEYRISGSGIARAAFSVDDLFVTQVLPELIYTDGFETN